MHILLKNCIPYKKIIKPEPSKEFIYDNLIGAWISKIDNSLLVNNSNFPSIATKKADIETGEDQKRG